MADQEHRILGALEEFKKAQIEANRVNREEHRDMMREITSIKEWRWKVEGARMALVGVFGGAAGALFQKLSKFL